MDVAVLQETKISQAKFAPRRFKGYTMRVAPTNGQNCGGVVLAVREIPSSIENERIVGPNVISFEMVVAKDKRRVVVGCYLPPSDKGRRHSGWRRPPWRGPSWTRFPLLSLAT